MYLFMRIRGVSGGYFFYCFVICNATKNVHGNYKQTKSIKRKKKVNTLWPYVEQSAT